MPDPLIIFDLDGTIADTAPDLIGTLNRITEPHGISPVGVNTAGQVIGQGARAMIALAFELNGRSLVPDQHDELFSHFLEDYERNIAVHTRLFDGLNDALIRLKENGFRFAVCTNKTERLARKLLTELELAHWFASVTGGDTFPYRKPDPRHLAETINLADARKSSSVMIGDSVADIEAAKRLGIPSIGVTFGYSDVPIETLDPDRIISSFNDLPATMSEIRSRLT